MDELDRYDALGLGELVAGREVQPAELLDRAIARVEAVNPAINAVVLKHYDEARAQLASEPPSGPFAGVPFLLKDLNVGLAGTVTTEGCRAFADHVSPADTTLVRRAKAAGLVVFGKTASPEFGLTTTTESRLWGQTRNPWNLDRIAGGSSGGAAASVAARISPIAHASDGGGSIRIPAACCGLFGLKPSRGRVATGPGAGIGWNGLSCQHAVSISVRDSAALLDALAGPEIGDSIIAPQTGPYREAAGREPARLRIALVEAPASGAAVHSDCREALLDAARLCESLGHEVEPLALDLDAGALGEAMTASIAVDIAARLDACAQARGRPITEDDVEAVTWRFAERGRTVTGPDYVAARRTFDMAAARYAARYADYDVVLSPVLAAPPVRLGELRLDQDIGAYARAIGAFSPYTALHNQIGAPAMSVPLFWNAEGLPIGVMFAAPFGREDLLYSLAGQLEGARPWSGRLPPTVA
ncbi:amidase [Phenylobacterium montanum]|uniref:Amidase n=1 Tax=Phenylobacterium montanum TaxID=2823693 RepID=A0A975IUR6_9CAUL|nr:amidase [Caulobacter sp. S6]QUD88068.1 amidase [Caulobacter sp. S6]